MKTTWVSIIGSEMDKLPQAFNNSLVRLTAGETVKFASHCNGVRIHVPLYCRSSSEMHNSLDIISFRDTY